ncbi:M56 family metallopeptidase [Sporosarcina limicola]|uniref:Beta-lactamase regulating signal transducer with metallopeptidase domain/sRNA-binding carbon storage regulator CsrA n=1 Tax=Sporosarcina limicola TaxID=34101 RepID=A0A927MJY9_9BACL|nr:M56 family metallopeptidase [Sporosarcina limicola]MBE1556100.1 beta-lactamase regulating signal transducer with metallopeptidase domain/sRNA-binding carbon storage regulator CsrA [Sporosarcina limicola]
MLMNMYTQLLMMSVIAGVFYLILKMLSTVTLKYFTATWHYYSNIVIATLFLIPYHYWLSRLDLNIIPKIDKVLNLPSIMRFSPTSQTALPPELVQVESYSIGYSILVFLPYLLLMGTLVFIAIVIVQNYKANQRIVSLCRLTDDQQIVGMLSICKQEMGISEKIPVYISSSISSPFLSGIFHPRIVLPNVEFQLEELRCIFLHELTHWKRHDAWIKCLLLLINAVHWFNPLVYMARRDIDHFCELSCDESVVKSMNNQERRRYCELILNVLWNVADQRVKLFSAFSDKQKHLERRITMILKNENFKSKKWIRVSAIMLTLGFMSVGAIVADAASAKQEVYTDNKVGVSVAKVVTGGKVGARTPKVVTGGKVKAGVKTPKVVTGGKVKASVKTPKVVTGGKVKVGVRTPKVVKGGKVKVGIKTPKVVTGGK